MIGELLTRRGYLRVVEIPTQIQRAGGEDEEMGDDGTISFVFSSEDPASDEHVLLQDGWELEEYRKNPVFLWGHDLGSWLTDAPPAPPIGRVEDIGVVTDAVGRKTLEGKVRFAEGVDPDTNQPYYPEARRAAYLYRERFLRDVSVGFRVLNATPRASLGKEHPLYSDRGLVINRAALYEISGVPLGADKNAKSKPRKESAPQEQRNDVAPIVEAPSSFDAWFQLTPTSPETKS
jgi:hypothetical protein